MTTALHERDFYAWTQQQADLLKNEDYAELDLANLIEEIEDMGNNSKHELSRRLMRILEHLLKLTHEPQSRAARHWRRTILTQRVELDRLLSTNYTLRAQAGNYLDDAYRRAKLLAADGLECSDKDFPESCPWSIEQVLNPEFLP
ncbi:MAG: DUF29 domain-containing protein [Caldilineaceae bacterium]